MVNNKQIIHYVIHALLVLIIIGLSTWLAFLLNKTEKKCVVCPDPNIKLGNIVTKIPDTVLKMKIIRTGSGVKYTSNLYYSESNNIAIDYSTSNLPFIKDVETGDNLVLDINGNNKIFKFIQGEPTVGQYKAQIVPKPGTQKILVYANVDNQKYYLNPEPFDPRNIKCPMVLNSEASRTKKLHTFITL